MFFKTKYWMMGILLALFAGCGGSTSHPSSETGRAWAVGYQNTAGFATVLRSDDAGATWYTPDANATELQHFDATGLIVPSEEEVWVIGSGQTLLHTRDGGNSWEKIATFPDANTSVTFHDISAYSASEFWISAEHGNVYHTRDSGLHWERMDPEVFHNGLVQGIRVINAATVYAVGQTADFSRGFVSRTTDGGQTWKDVILPDDDNDNLWIGVTSSDPDHIVIYGCKGHYSVSEDGGKHWKNGRIDIDGGVNGSDINDMIMLDAAHWWSAMDLDNIYLTDDGGEHWKKQESAGQNNMYLVGIDATDENRALIVGTASNYPPAGKILLTHDGGQHWSQQHLTDTYMAKVSFVHRPDTNKTTEETSTFSGTLIQNVSQKLLAGAAGKVGSVVMGLILEELGWGDSENAQEEKLLESMKRQLGDIVYELGIIENELNTLAAQLKLDTEDIKKNILDPTEAINDIGTTHDEFTERFKTQHVGEGNATRIHTFVDEHIVNDFHIENDVNTIYHSIVPPTVAKTPALTNFTDYLFDSYRYGNGTLTDAYRTLELYTSQLIIHQLKGVNLVVEAKHVKENNDSVRRYMNDYLHKLDTMIADPSNGESFIYNAYRLALLDANPLPYKEGERFMDEATDALLARAVFYRLQATDANVSGVRMLVFETLDTNSSKTFYLSHTQNDKGYSSFACTPVTNPVPGHIYDRWDGSRVKPETRYNIFECTLAQRLKAGKYRIYDRIPGSTADYGGSIAQVQVRNYDENFTVTEDGNISYGLTTLFRRSPLNHFDEHSGRWHSKKGDDKCAETTGNPPWGVGIENIPDCGYTDYSGSYEIRSAFSYDGPKAKDIIVIYDAKFFAHIAKAYHGDSAKGSVSFGIWDETDDKKTRNCTPFYHFSRDEKAGHTTDRHFYPKGSCRFTAEPGHRYRVYFKMTISGLATSTGYETFSHLYLDSIRHIYLFF